MSGLSFGLGLGKIGASVVTSTTAGAVTLVAAATNASGLILRSLFCQFDAQYGYVRLSNGVYLAQTQTAALGPSTAIAWCGELLVPAGLAIEAWPRDASPGLGRVILSYDLL